MLNQTFLGHILIERVHGLLVFICKHAFVTLQCYLKGTAKTLNSCYKPQERTKRN